LASLQHLASEQTIVAMATPQGAGAIAIIRLSGPESIAMVNAVFKGKDLSTVPSHTIHFGTIRNGQTIVDEVLVSVFIAPRSYTREDVIEISCHGSPYIVKQILQLLIRQGARAAMPGEFTRRAFMNGQLDLAQAEAVADLINAGNEAAHKAALAQMRGGFSHEIQQLRQELIHFASMIELELDFSEEDVEFASRQDLTNLVQRLHTVVSALIESFDLGNVIKNGVPTVIAGKPNAGKSTLLNALLKEEKAIVSNIPGTTRDFIEDELVIHGVAFRFIDTAGLRQTTDTVEAIGVERTQEKMKQASLIIFLFDLTTESLQDIYQEINKLENQGIPFIPVGNKVDLAPALLVQKLEPDTRLVLISAGQKQGLDALQERLLKEVNLDSFKTGDTVVTNARHYQSLLQTKESLEAVLNGIDQQITGDFLALDIRQALHYLGEITGEITTDDLLANIFSKFCIGK